MGLRIRQNKAKLEDAPARYENLVPTSSSNLSADLRFLEDKGYKNFLEIVFVVALSVPSNQDHSKQTIPNTTQRLTPLILGKVLGGVAQTFLRVKLGKSF